MAGENQSDFAATYNSPVGDLSIFANEHAITHIRFGSCQKTVLNNVIGLALLQLKQYFDGSLKQFTVPIQPSGTNFQHQVWDQLQQVEWGHTCSYGDIASAINKPGASRGVGKANNTNPIPIIIPCHRIVGSKGELTGYAGGLEIKTFLLSMESSILSLDFGEN